MHQELGLFGQQKTPGKDDVEGKISDIAFFSAPMCHTGVMNGIRKTEIECFRTVPAAPHFIFTLLGRSSALKTRLTVDMTVKFFDTASRHCVVDIYYMYIKAPTVCPLGAGAVIVIDDATW